MSGISYNPRVAIHDAFARHLTSSDKMNPGAGTKMDSTAATYYSMKAGLVIRVVLEQPEHLKNMALFLNAPDAIITSRELVKLKSRVWADYIRKHRDMTAAEQGDMASMVDYLMIGYKSRVWDPGSDTHTAAGCLSLLGYGSGRAKRGLERINRMLDVISELDSKSLEPVYALIDDQRDKLEAAAIV